MTIQDVLDQSPHLSGYDDEPVQMVFYGARCCWWTSFPDDLGKAPPIPVEYNSRTGVTERQIRPSIPCCPHCGSVLYQAPLVEFIKSAEEHASHYGRGGLESFLRAHHRNSGRCHSSWDRYEVPA